MINDRYSTELGRKIFCTFFLVLERKEINLNIISINYFLMQFSIFIYLMTNLNYLPSVSFLL